MSQTALSFTRFLFLFLFFTASVKAQKEAKDFNVDSTLYAYYQRCQECLLQPVVLSMSDTLYRMAEERHDKRMQAVAISTQLDYHYFQATNEDSIRQSNPTTQVLLFRMVEQAYSILSEKR